MHDIPGQTKILDAVGKATNPRPKYYVSALAA